MERKRGLGMDRVVDLDGHNQVFLQMELKKGSLGTDDNGKWVFDVEASNENLDFEGQRVLQNALLNSKEYFLTNGVVSKDHLHQRTHEGGKILYDESYVIGEPRKVYVQDGKVRVRGCLYKSNEYAQEFAKLLNDNSTRVKASVGGLFPKVVKRKENGVDVGDVVSVLWNDLALTIAPVNPTVGPAVLVKSLSSFEFVKSLSAGHGTDAATFSGGRALQKEDVGHEKVNPRLNDEAVIASLVGAIADGDVEDLEEAEEFLNGYGISKAVAREMIRGIVENSEEFMEVLPMAKGSLWDEIAGAAGRLRKALGGTGDDDVDPDKLEQGAGGDDDDGDDDDDEEKVEDATPVLKALAEHIEKLEETNEVIAKSLAALVEQNTRNAVIQKSIGESVLAVMEGQKQFAASPAPRRSAVSALDAMLKGGFGGGAARAGADGGTRRHQQFTRADLDDAKDILCKAVAAKTLTVIEATQAETQINKSILNPAYQIDEKFVKILREGAKA
ncbi:MAG: hypothetical protein LBL45_07665 [Treponema sp.]|jgi:hypothetical protein|nr:hypothetical protein [Treponema sp.]